MNRYIIQIGDFVSHKDIPKTIGIAYKEVQFLPDIFFEVHWIVHPDIDMYGDHGIINSKWLRPFKPWRGFYKRGD